MIANVPKAAVIITNPTHYSVALQYERGMEAPVCVAKGVDALALKIREVAGEHSIPIVENPPLARALHATVEVDQAIPIEHYKAVAEVIGYVMRLRRAVVPASRIKARLSKAWDGRGLALAPIGRLKALRLMAGQRTRSADAAGGGPGRHAFDKSQSAPRSGSVGLVLLVAWR